MTLVYNGKTYDVSPDSTYMDIIIPAVSLEKACEIAEELSGMTAYTFNLGARENMVVQKRMIVLENGTIYVRVAMRARTELEKAQAELEEIRAAIADIEGELSPESAAAHPCLFPDITNADNVEPGHHYLVNGVVTLVNEVIEEPITLWVSNHACGGGKNNG